MAELKTPDWNEICKILDEKGFFEDGEEKKTLQKAFKQHCDEEQSMVNINPFR